ncbi:MAG: Asp-tRNA(Asn)/Glu-tRNA(Gln) amidotransferase subunit GatA [Bradymonadaceae bacterium]
MEYNELTIAELRDGFADEEFTAVEVVESYIGAIREGDDYNAYIALRDADELIDEAVAIDERRDAGDPVGPLAGVPIAIKDNICTASTETTAASRMLEDFEPPYEATVVERLDEAGAIVLGKTNLDEFAMGSSNETSHFGPAKNPADPERTPGGSSGGSAAAVAADLCAGALGSDTGGSIRQPAAHSGVVGLKPTYGRVSRYGLIAFASSLDQIGPIAKTTEDAALILEAIAGHDRRDATSVDRSVPVYHNELEDGVEGLRVGVPEEYFDAEVAVDEAVVERVTSAIDDLEEAGAEIVDVSLPHTEYAVATYYLIATAEASSNLARYDGVRYGHRAQEVDELVEMYEKTRAEGFGDEVKRRIMLGTYVLSAGYYEDYYQKAQKVRTLIRRDFEEAFDEVDVLAAPTTPTPAFELGEKIDDPLQLYLQDVYTTSCNIAGLPGISVPCGRTDEDLPVGLQLMAPTFDESTLVRAARAVEAG